jgi:hypothetical protein
MTRAATDASRRGAACVMPPTIDDAPPDDSEPPTQPPPPGGSWWRGLWMGQRDSHIGYAPGAEVGTAPSSGHSVSSDKGNLRPIAGGLNLGGTDWDTISVRVTAARRAQVYLNVTSSQSPPDDRQTTGARIKRLSLLMRVAATCYHNVKRMGGGCRQSRPSS